MGVLDVLRPPVQSTEPAPKFVQDLYSFFKLLRYFFFTLLVTFLGTSLLLFLIHYGIENNDSKNIHKEVFRKAKVNLAQPAPCLNGLIEVDRCLVYHQWAHRSWYVSIAYVAMEKMIEDWTWMVDLWSWCAKDDVICQHNAHNFSYGLHTNFSTYVYILAFIVSLSILSTCLMNCLTCGGASSKPTTSTPVPAATPIPMAAPYAYQPIPPMYIGTNSLTIEPIQSSVFEEGLSKRMRSKPMIEETKKANIEEIN
jgi:hypothetical protein